MTDRPARAPRRHPRQQVRRIAERARYDVEALHAVLDAGWLAHVGFAVDGQPFVIPMLHARDGDRVLLHGSIASRLMTGLAAGVPCCLTVTHVDGLVLARSHFHHSVNYRSAVVFGHAREIVDDADKRRALECFVERLVPGRAADARAADRQEAAATRVVALEIEDFSVKTRSGGPSDHVDDLTRPTWAGVLPLALCRGALEPANDLAPGVALPDYLARLSR